MALATIDARLLKPYVSFVVFVQPRAGGSVDIVCRTIRRYIEDDERSELLGDGLSARPALASTSTEIVLALAFVNHRQPPWGGLTAESGPEHGDRVHHLVLVVQSGDLLAVHTTDDRIKEHLLRKQAKLQLGGVGLLDRPALEAAFLRGDIATFWMGEGSARRGQRGPRSKTTYGDHLEDTIDVIGDQRHTLAGARAKAGEELLGPGRQGVIGTNLAHSSAWYARAANLAEYVQVVGEMLKAIREVLASGGGRERFVVFARYVDDLDAVEKPYDLSFTPPDAVPGVVPSEELVDAYNWLETHLVELSASGKRTARLTVAGDSGEFATVAIKPERQGVSKIGLRVDPVDGDPMLLRRLSSAIERLGPTIYYESGHSVSSRGILVEYFADIPFGGWMFDPLDGVDVSIEKPGDRTRKAIRDLGGTARDGSLFGWVIRHRRTGWLYCDDGPDELCDFVHFDEDKGTLEIWHVKACKAGDRREVAAVPYEQVCAQSVKNLPTLFPQRLASELESRHQSGDVGPLWHDGHLVGDVAGLITALRKPRANLRINVVVFQPHVTEMLLIAARSGTSAAVHGERQRLRRLDHLLVATDDAVARLGAHLQVLTMSKAHRALDLRDHTKGDVPVLTTDMQRPG